MTVIPTEPLYIRAEEGDMKIPDPIMTARMTLTAEKRPMLRFSLTASVFSSLFESDESGCTDSFSEKNMNF